jgi:hypothetical protein
LFAISRSRHCKPRIFVAASACERRYRDNREIDRSPEGFHEFPHLVLIKHHSVIGLTGRWNLFGANDGTADMASARAQVQAFEQRPPPHYQVARPIMRTLLEMGEAADMKDAYEKAMSLVRSVSDGRDSVQRKLRA